LEKVRFFFFYFYSLLSADWRPASSLVKKIGELLKWVLPRNPPVVNIRVSQKPVMVKGLACYKMKGRSQASPPTMVAAGLVERASLRFGGKHPRGWQRMFYAKIVARTGESMLT
jgi:hypothetical protein